MKHLKLTGILLLILLVITYFYPVDSTDFSWLDRSGLRLHVDTATGCHYVSTLFGGPTARLDSNGRQVCSGPDVN